ncbi:MAG: cysteine hydrolase [Bacteroidota bacterium]
MKKIILWIFIGIVVIVASVLGTLMIFEKNALVISKGKVIENYPVEKPALLVIDIQEGLTGSLSSSECYTKGSDAYINKVNTLIEKSNEDSLPVIYVRNEITNWFINLLNNSYAKGNPSAGFDKRLKITSGYLITKDKSDSFCNPALDSILIKNKVNKLFVVGLDAAFCVNSTIDAAKNRGYKIAVISDAVLSKSDTMKIRMLNEYRIKNVEIMASEEFLKRQ